jgi:hypothetical protein
MTCRMALRLAGDLLVGVHSGGVQTDRTMYGSGPGRGSAPRLAATWRRRVDALPNSGSDRSVESLTP